MDEKQKQEKKRLKEYRKLAMVKCITDKVFKAVMESAMEPSLAIRTISAAIEEA